MVVTDDVKEALAVADYAYVISDGAIVGKGTPQEIKSSHSAYLRPFVNALTDGPVRFHFPAPPLEEDLRLTPAGPSRQALASFGVNCSATPLLQHRLPVGCGPASYRCAGW